MTSPSAPSIAIACGGTGGHLFPGLAVAEQLVQRGCSVTLLISPKDIDQQAVQAASGMEIVTLPAVGLSRGRVFAFVRGFAQSYWAAKKLFRSRPPQAALAMGGFTSAPPILAAKRAGARTFIHESNTIPGRANRWLARAVNQAFVGFTQAGSRLRNAQVTVTGTPVRPQFQALDAAACRKQLFGGTVNDRATVLVMGGSQGASGINELILKTLPLLATSATPLQFVHLTGPNDADKVRKAYAALKLALVHPFFTGMELALGAATVAVSRAGASSLAELAAMRLPSVLIPYPAATDNHQFYNAQAYEKTGAARRVDQDSATPEAAARMILELVENESVRQQMQAALFKWHTPKAAEEIAECILKAIAERQGTAMAHGHSHKGCCGHDHGHHRSADLESAVSQSCTLLRQPTSEASLAPMPGRLQICDTSLRLASARQAAEFNSALQHQA